MKIGLFQLLRLEDTSGISGTGLVAVGIVFPTGQVAMQWLTPTTSIALYDSLEDVERIHGHAGKTLIRRWETILNGRFQEPLR